MMEAGCLWLRSPFEAPDVDRTSARRLSSAPTEGGPRGRSQLLRGDTWCRISSCARLCRNHHEVVLFPVAP